MASRPSNKLYPKIAAFDLDGTIWRGWLNEKWVGQKGRVSNCLQENLKLSRCREKTIIIRDRKNEDFRCIVASDIAHIIQDLRKHHVASAIVSRNTNKNLTDRALWLIDIKDPQYGNMRHFTDLLEYNEVKDVSKMEHFNKQWSKVEFREMVLFDGQIENMNVELWKGVIFIKVDEQIGITWRDYNRGLNQWRRYNPIQFRIPQLRIKSQNAKLIGYVGAGEASAMRYREGKRRLKSNRASRWGHATYITDDPQVEDAPQNQYVVAIYTRDLDAFKKLNKVWVPEYGTFHQINNMNQTDEENMEDMTFLSKRARFNEMVVYPNIQEALFFGEPFPISNFVADRKEGR